MNKDLVAIFEYLEREKGIKRETIIKAIEESLQVAARKSMKGVGPVNVTIDPKSGTIQVKAEKEVVETVTYPEEEITLEVAILQLSLDSLFKWRFLLTNLEELLPKPRAKSFHKNCGVQKGMSSMKNTVIASTNSSLELLNVSSKGQHWLST